MTTEQLLQFDLYRLLKPLSGACSQQFGQLTNTRFSTFKDDHVSFFHSAVAYPGAPTSRSASGGTVSQSTGDGGVILLNIGVIDSTIVDCDQFYLSSQQAVATDFVADGEFIWGEPSAVRSAAADLDRLVPGCTPIALPDGVFN